MSSLHSKRRSLLWKTDQLSREKDTRQTSKQAEVFGARGMTLAQLRGESTALPVLGTTAGRLSFWSAGTTTPLSPEGASPLGLAECNPSSGTYPRNRPKTPCFGSPFFASLCNVDPLRKGW